MSSSKPPRSCARRRGAIWIARLSRLPHWTSWHSRSLLPASRPASRDGSNRNSCSHLRALGRLELCRGKISWRVLKSELGTMRVADAQGQPPTIPFWLGEGPSRTAELSAEIAQLREDVGCSLLVGATPASPYAGPTENLGDAGVAPTN